MDVTALKGQAVWVMAKGYVPDEGGMQTYAQGVAEAYASAGADVTVFTQTSAGPRQTTIGRCHVIDIGAKKGVSVPFRFRAALSAVLEKGPMPMLTHGTTWRTSIIPLSLGLQYFTTFHGREFMYAGGIMAWLMRRVAAQAQAVIAVSNYSAERLKARLKPVDTDPVVAWNGIGFQPATSHNKQSAANTIPLLFSLCRLEPRKNIAACVKACATLRDEGFQFRYAIAGRGEELDPIRALITELDLADCVEALGFVSDQDAAQYYRDADIFLHPQVGADGGRDFEGFGIAIADAMIAETAVIVGEEGGAIELVEQGISGIAVNGHDNDAITGALRGLLSDPNARQKMAKSGAARAAELFTWDRHIATILANLPD